ncbi:MAG: PAS domain-containing sensor histidine kinase [Methylococcales bacterium]|nr:PAS domain-containing sensor histidine kinase [Methylococcales bacterium]
MYKKILAHLNEAILLFNHQLILTYINSAGEILLSDSSNHLLGLSAIQLFKSSDSALLIDLQQCLSTKEPLVDRELNLVHLNHSMTVNFGATPILEDGQVNEIVVELQQVDRQLRITKDEQLFAQQTVSQMLVKGLAHEIKNPLGGIRGAAQLLDIELQDPELKEYTQVIIQESDRLKSLMDKMLGPNKPSKKESLNIHVVLNRIHQLINVEANSITIKTDYDPSIPMLKADKNQLIQAILNIVQNAVQAMNNTGILILKTRIQRHMTIGRKFYKLTARIDIIDNGHGIEPNLMNQIFYPMITNRADGTGLGLSIAQSLINQHNGLIECESEPGNTRFSIYLPLENNHV